MSVMIVDYLAFNGTHRWLRGYNARSLPRVREVWRSNPGRPDLTQCCKRFATASTSTKVIMLLRNYVTEMGPQDHTLTLNTLKQ